MWKCAKPYRRRSRYYDCYYNYCLQWSNGPYRKTFALWHRRFSYLFDKSANWLEVCVASHAVQPISTSLVRNLLMANDALPMFSQCVMMWHGMLQPYLWAPESTYEIIVCHECCGISIREILIGFVEYVPTWHLHRLRRHQRKWFWYVQTNPHQKPFAKCKLKHDLWLKRDVNIWNLKHFSRNSYLNHFSSLTFVPLNWRFRFNGTLRFSRIETEWLNDAFGFFEQLLS